MNIQKNIIVFSVNQASQTRLTNDRNHFATFEHLQRVLGSEFEVAEGVYKGQAENSFIINDTPINRVIVSQLAKKYHQESVLFINAKSQAVLLYRDASAEVLSAEVLSGTWQVVSQRKAQKLTASTFVNGLSFAVV